MHKNPKRKAEIGSSSLEAEIFTKAVHHSDSTLTAINQLLSIWGVTALQHSALRVIYVHDTDDLGLPSGEIGKHLITRVPDITRLLDRMADKGWMTRERDDNNRRVVRAKLTSIGIELVESISSPLKALEKERLTHMSENDKHELNRLLDLATANEGS